MVRAEQWAELLERAGGGWLKETRHRQGVVVKCARRRDGSCCLEVNGALFTFFGEREHADEAIYNATGSYTGRRPGRGRFHCVACTTGIRGRGWGTI